MNSVERLAAINVCNHPVFVIGSPRSGTSILAWSLHQHPDFWTSHETELLHHLFARLKLKDIYAAATSRPETWLVAHKVDYSEFLGYMGMGVNALFTSRSDGKRWVDQTPGYTLMADLLAEMFPKAYFLHIVRDGRAVVRSMVHFRDSLGKSLDDSGGLPHWAKSFQAAVQTWCQYVRSANTLSERYPNRVLTIRNETLSANPDCEFQRIFEFLQARYYPDSANFFGTSRINSSFTPLKWGTSVPPSDPKVATASPPSNSAAEMAWAEWSPEERRLFDQEAGELMRSLGYRDR